MGTPRRRGDFLQYLTRCHIRLVRVAQATGGRWVEHEGFAAPVRLKWSFAGLDHPEVEFRDIRPGEPALADVAFTLERARRASAHSELGPRADWSAPTAWSWGLSVEGAGTGRRP